MEEKCSICGNDIETWPHTAHPIEEGLACVKCWSQRVIIERQKLAKKAYKKNKKGEE